MKTFSVMVLGYRCNKVFTGFGCVHNILLLLEHEMTLNILGYNLIWIKGGGACDTLFKSCIWIFGCLFCRVCRVRWLSWVLFPPFRIFRMLIWDRCDLWYLHLRALLICSRFPTQPSVSFVQCKASSGCTRKKTWLGKKGVGTYDNSFDEEHVA